MSNAKDIKIRAIPFSDRIIDYGKGGLSITEHNTLTVDIGEFVEHSVRGELVSTFEKHTTMFFPSEKDRPTIRGRYLRVTVVGKDKVGWELLDKLPELHKPKNLKDAASFHEKKT